jgi:ribonuclease HI
MRVFTDGSCIGNGRKGAKAGYAVWFPEHREWSVAKRVPDEHSQTNQRAELSAIHEAVSILDQKGYYDDEIVIYTDSDYSINCLTKWIPGWVSRNWKTAEGKDVLHQDLIRGISDTLTKFKSHRFHHVRAHTGGGDDLSVNNDIVDRMARGTVEEVKVIEPPAVDQLFEGCPLQLMGPPVPGEKLMTWIRENLESLDKDIFNKHLLKAFTEQCKLKEVNITKQTLQKQLMYRAERVNLQVSKVVIEKIE